MNRDIPFKYPELEKLTVKHPKQEEAKDRIEFFANYASSVSLIVLAGPSGVGKSTLLERLIQSFQHQHAATIEADPSAVPIVYTQAVANGHKSFDFRRLYTDALKALHDPFARYKSNRKDEEPRRRLEGESKTSARLREDLEDEMRSRQTLVWIIDEAHHVVRGGKSGKPGDQFDILKSFAQITGVKLVLAGTYDLPQFLASSGQLSRRSATVQLDRYHWHDKKERNIFASVAARILKELPMKAVPNAAANSEYFYVHCCGCVGICKDWIMRAFAIAMQEGTEELTLDHLEQARLDNEQLETISADIERGEHFMKRANGAQLDSDTVARILGKQTNEIAQPQTQNRPRSSKLKPGNRAPGRDAVGGVAA